MPVITDILLLIKVRVDAFVEMLGDRVLSMYIAQYVFKSGLNQAAFFHKYKAFIFHNIDNGIIRM